MWDKVCKHSINIGLCIYGLFIMGALFCAITFDPMLLRNIERINFKFLISILLGCVFLYFIHRKTKGNYDWWILGFLILGTIGWQIYVVCNARQYIDFDVAVLARLVKQDTVTEPCAYLSLYKNNIPIFLLYKIAGSILGRPVGYGVMGMLGLIMVDTGFVFIILIAREYNKKYTKLYILFSLAILCLFGWMLCPYTDSYSILFTSCFIWSLVKYQKSEHKRYLVLAGVNLVLMYYMKPSLLIFAIALVIIIILRMHKTIVRKTFIAGGVALVAMTATYIPLQYGINHQTYVTIDPEMDTPSPLHWMNIGMKGYGGYSRADAKMMYKLKDSASKNEYSIKEIKKSLRSFGFGGYIKFLATKFDRNVRDGTFSFFMNHAGEDTKEPTNLAQNVFWNTGRYTGTRKWMAQILWISILGILALTIRDKRLLWLKIAWVGFMLFLLLFEGGRTRYLIQVLPAILVLFYINLENGKNKLQNIIYAIRTDA